MRIAVLIKQVPESNSVRMDESTGTMARSGVEAIVNPLDLYAVEVALQLREQYGGSISTVSMGPPAAESALREVLAMGADDALLLSDRCFAGSDTWCTGYALAAALRKTGPYDLILCGERATDGDTGQIGPGVAAFLDLPVITYASCVPDIVEGNRGRIDCLREHGYEHLEFELPAVIGLVKEAASPRLPTLRGKQRARRTVIPILNADDLGLESSMLGLKGSPTRVVRVFRPKISREGELLPARDDEEIEKAAERVAAFLGDNNLL